MLTRIVRDGGYIKRERESPSWYLVPLLTRVLRGAQPQGHPYRDEERCGVLGIPPTGGDRTVTGVPGGKAAPGPASLTVGRAPVNRWVSGSLQPRPSIRAAKIHVVSFQSLPKLEESGLRWQTVGLLFALLKSERDAMKTKTNVKAGQRIATR